MSPTFSITVNGQTLPAETGDTVLSVCNKNNVPIPTLCHLDGLSEVGACRLCLVEVEGTNKLLPACVTMAAPNQKVQTETERLQKNRRMALELFLTERNHICAVCVVNGNCELQNLAASLGVTSVRLPFLDPACDLDASNSTFILDHNRCIMCTRCVRVCDEVEGAHNWNIMGRGTGSRIIADFNQPWSESTTCTYCGKCVNVCPTGALWKKGSAPGVYLKHPDSVPQLVIRRKAQS